MGVFIKCSAMQSSSPYAYAKMEMEDPEDLKHRQAQFLIYKVMQKADQDLCNKRKQQSSSSLSPSNCLIKMRIICSRLKIKIGRKLKKLRKSTVFITMSAARVCVIKKVLLGQLKALKRVLACNSSGTMSSGSSSIALPAHFIK